LSPIAITRRPFTGVMHSLPFFDNLSGKLEGFTGSIDPAGTNKMSPGP
jgi:hypothetical protein